MQLLFAQQLRGPAPSDLGDAQGTASPAAVSSTQVGTCVMPGVGVLCIYPSHEFEGN